MNVVLPFHCRWSRSLHQRSFYVPQAGTEWSSCRTDGDLLQLRKHTFHGELLANFPNKRSVRRVGEVKLLAAAPTAWQLIQECHPDANPWRPVREIPMPTATTTNEK
jgi:hypothetical protein